ncbi:MAG: hypothetical protein WC514_02980 [Candidatus Paceibacterota bacterium]
MEELISKNELEELMKIKGETRGTTFKEDEDFILQERGKEGMEKMKEALVKLGCPIKFEDIHGWEFYPVGLEAVMLLLMKRLLGFGDDKIEECGFFGSRASFIIKVFLSHFVSIKMFAKQAPVMWNKYYTLGSLKIKELSEDNRQAIIAVEDFCLHPLHCLQLKGYFRGILGMIISQKVTCEEIKCIHKGDACHEFLIKY